MIAASLGQKFQRARLPCNEEIGGFCSRNGEVIAFLLKIQRKIMLYLLSGLGDFSKIAASFGR